MRKQPKPWDSQRERQKRERQLSGCGPAHLPLEAGRQAGDSQSRKARGKLGPRDGIPYRTESRPPVANQVFLGSRTVDICQEVRSQRISSPEKTHGETERLDWGDGKTHCPP